MRSISLFLIAILFISLFPSSFADNPMRCSITYDPQGHEKDSCPSLHTCVNNQCVHKDIFPLTTEEIVGSFLIMLIGGLHSSGGLGGGSKMAPILYTLFDYDTAKTISIVYILIFGGSLGNFLNVFRKRDPRTKKPLIIYDLALVIMPSMVIGTNVGVIANQVVAPIVTLAGVTVVMYSNMKKTYAKAKKTYAKENKKKNSSLLDADRQLNSESDCRFDSDAQPTEFDTNSSTMSVHTGDDKLDLLEEEERKRFPKRKLGLIFSLLLFTTAMTYLRGTDKLPSIIGIDHCGPTYWGFFLLSFVGIGGFFLYNRIFVLRRIRIKKEAGALVPTEEDYRMEDERDIKKLFLLGAKAGFLAGLLGVGGGLVLNPALMKLGLDAQSLAATVGFFVLQTAFVSLFQSFLYGNVSDNELIYFFLISVIGSFLVSVMMAWIVKKTDRPSILLWLQLGVVVVSIVAMPAFAVWRAIEHPEEMFTFSPVC